jgi:hypothetical protein
MSQNKVSVRRRAIDAMPSIHSAGPIGPARVAPVLQVSHSPDWRRIKIDCRSCCGDFEDEEFNMILVEDPEFDHVA